MTISPAEDRLRGILLGTALGDALGLPAEGMSARAIARRFGRMDRFRLLGSTGFVSDDTEQAALIAEAIARHPDDLELCVADFRRSLFGWFCRLPWGVGRATIRSCLKIGLRISPSGVRSAGNGAAMRAAIIGGFFADQPERRRAFGKALAEVTHRDSRAVEGALYVAELSAICSNHLVNSEYTSMFALFDQARKTVRDRELGQALDRARELALQEADLPEAAEECGTTGFVIHTLAFATFGFLRASDRPDSALTDIIAAGGDTDSIASILGGWLGALHGESRLPLDLIDRIHNGPFGPSHLRGLAHCLAERREGRPCRPPRYSVSASLLRNLLLYPVILGHGFRRLIPL